MSKMAAEDLTSVSIPISRDYSSPSPSLTTWKRGSRGRGLHSVKKQHRTEYETLEGLGFGGGLTGSPPDLDVVKEVGNFLVVVHGEEDDFTAVTAEVGPEALGGGGGMGSEPKSLFELILYDMIPPPPSLQRISPLA
ncbi:hypothetical protein LINPERHAP1_LOCUS27568 [Linum perenne]